jgi:NAD(P) transhydrogenase subunit beta
MDNQSLLTIACLVASVLFILSLRGLSSQESSKRGNAYGMIGMLFAVVATVLIALDGNFAAVIGAVVIASGIGWLLASRVAMTAMPELVAVLHSFVGMAAVLVGFASYLGHGEHGSLTIFHIEIWVDIFIGAITFTGSVLAFLKLRGSVSGSPLILPGRHFLNLAMLVTCLFCAYKFVGADTSVGLPFLLVVTVVASILGVHLVAAIGGADMPVVVSMLNSYSGWTASAAGFMLSNDLLIITGALVGSSGAILSYIMCKAMNRSIWNVIFGGFGTAPVASGKSAVDNSGKSVMEYTDDETVDAIKDAKNVIIVPGYGMAVARAQHAVNEMTALLRKRGCKVRFAIHPVAGRLPGHMNVLLAEANVPYDIVLEMEEINEDFDDTDVVLVIGANDIVNPGAMDDEASPIYGMPVLEVWNAKRTVMMKRSRRTGYAGVDNPLFYHENTRMLFGDARETMDKLNTGLRN